MMVPAPNIAAIPSAVANATVQDIFPKNNPKPTNTRAIVEIALPARPVNVFTTLQIVLSRVVVVPEAAAATSGSAVINTAAPVSYTHLTLPTSPKV